MSIQSSRIYYINTENRLSGSTSNFQYNVQIPPNSGFDRCVVLQASVPISFYLIQDGYNTFLLRETSAANPHNDVTITIPPGNYTKDSLPAVVTPLLDTASQNQYKYTFSYQDAQQKYVYSVNNDAAVSVGFIFNSHLSQQFGFDKNSINMFPAAADAELSSTNVLNFAVEGTIFIHSNITNELTDVLQEVYTTTTNTIVQYQLSTNIDAYSKQLRSTGSNVFQFYITNEEDEELILQGQDCLITLLLYKSDNFTDLFRKFVNWSVQSDDEKKNLYSKPNMDIRRSLD